MLPGACPLLQHPEPTAAATAGAAAAAREQLEPALARRDGDDHVPYAPDVG